MRPPRRRLAILLRPLTAAAIGLALVATTISSAAAARGPTPTADQVTAALQVDRHEWAAEIPLIEEWFAKIGDSVPTSLRDELDSLKLRLGLS